MIGARFSTDLLTALDVDPALDELLGVELIDQVRFIPSAEYAFHHPLIRSVAYESQLKSARAQWHRRLATAIEGRDPESADQNAALIAEHLRAAGDLHAACGWLMRAAAWSTNRDLAAARISWERARYIADALPENYPDRISMRIAPRTMLCATVWQARDVQESRARFTELAELCTAAGDKTSLAIGMTGLTTELLYAGRVREGARLSSQQMALFDSIGDSETPMALVAVAFCNWLGVFDFGEILRWSQAVIDRAAGDPAKGAAFGIGSPLAIASAWRGTARWWFGRPDWREDLRNAVAMARRTNAETLSGVVAWTYGFALQHGVLLVDDTMRFACEEAVATAERASSDRAMGLAAYTLGVMLLNQDDAADRHRGLDMMMRARDIWERKDAVFLVPVPDVWAARETARSGDLDAAIGAMRKAVGELRERCPFYAAWGTGVLAETLLERAADGDLAEAQEAVDWLAGLATDLDSAMLDITLLHLRALIARARGDDRAYRNLVDSLSRHGGIAWLRGTHSNGPRRSC